MQTKPNPDKLTEAISAAIEPILAASGYDLENLVVRKLGKRSLLQIGIDSDTGIDLDELPELTRLLSDELDQNNLMGEQPYTLDVGSRGAESPLTLPRHWRRNLGRKVLITLLDGSTITDRIVSNDDTHVQLANQTVAFTDIAQARVQLEFRKDG